MEFIKNLQEQFNRMFQSVRINMKGKQRRQKVNYDLRQSGKPYQENDLVWLFTPQTKEGISSKTSKILGGSL